MATIRRSENGIDYLLGVLKEKATVVSRVTFWKIPHKTSREDIRLKLGRYNKKGFDAETVELANPRSELTLDNDEFQALIEFLAENYEPFKKGVRQYIPLDENFDQRSIDQLRALFNNPDRKKILRFIGTNNILPTDLVAALQTQARSRAIQEFEDMLNRNLVEHNWQKWFTHNDWVLGSEFVRVLDERDIDTTHISDYLMQAYDRFLDIIEIKRPEAGLRFWSDRQNHGNWVPSVALTNAIVQATRYI